jgi:protein arginine phosphatase
MNRWIRSALQESQASALKGPRMRRVLIICTGNQCRSAAAAAILEKLAREAGVEVEVLSAGTHAWDDIPAQPETIAAARGRGYDLARHRSRPITRALLQNVDVVLAMAGTHVRWLAAVDPQAPVQLFKPYCEGRAAAGDDDDIPDPVGQPLDVHERCVGDIESLLVQLVARWKREDA